MPPLSSDCSILRWVGHSPLPARQKTAVVPGRVTLTAATSVPRRYQDQCQSGRLSHSLRPATEHIDEEGLQIQFTFYKRP